MQNETCRHLRTKAMYVEGPPEKDAPHGVPPPLPVNFWCNRTQSEVGPDDRLVSPADCAAPGRPCRAPR